MIKGLHEAQARYDAMEPNDDWGCTVCWELENPDEPFPEGWYAGLCSDHLIDVRAEMEEAEVDAALEERALRGK